MSNEYDAPLNNVRFCAVPMDPRNLVPAIEVKSQPPFKLIPILINSELKCSITLKQHSFRRGFY